MPRLAISEFSTYRWSLEQEIQELSRRGIREIGIWRTKLSDMDVDAAADLLYAADMRVSSLSWAGGFTGSCGMTHEEAIEDAMVATRVASRIGAECLIVHPGNMRGHTRRHSMRLFRTAIDRLLPVAIDFGVSLGIETMRRDDAPGWTIFESFEHLVDFVCRYATSHVGLVLDLFHVGNQAHLLERADRILPHVNLVQMSDKVIADDTGHRCQLGDGIVPLQRWYDALEDGGYQGPYEFELHGPRFGHTRYRKMLDDSIVQLGHLQQQRARNRSLSAS